MKNITLLLLFICSALFGFSQSFEIGHTTITFNDASRTGGFGSGGGAGRQIQSEIYYPATTAGDDVAIANGEFPVIIFGHGFVMAWDAYQNIWEEFVPEGYVFVFPRTEGGFSPSHDEFGLDLSLLVDKMQAENDDMSSIFYNSLTDKSAIMGHSMGGGAAMLAAENNTSIETVIGLAPAETTPSAISAAPQISVPALIFSGSSDGVTPAVDHHQPIYDGLGSSCKYFLSITGGAHCYFANSNFNCDFGEGTSSTGITVTREEQHATTFLHLKTWLEYRLKNICGSLTEFQSDLVASTDVVNQTSCTETEPIINTNISATATTITAEETGISYQWVDCNDNNSPISGATSQTFTPSISGSYAVILDNGNCSVISDCESITLTSSLAEDEFNFEIYPNPTANNFTISSKESGSFQTIDLNGKIVLQSLFQIGNNTVITDLNEGIYIISVTAKSGKRYFKKLIINQ
jgi:dienelactone hydrolase